MSTREKIKQYFEQNGPDKQTRVAKELGVSRQRVNQIIRQDASLSKQYDELRFETNRQVAERSRRKYGANFNFKDFYSSNLRAEQAVKLSSKKSNVKRAGTTFDIVYGDLYWPTHCPVLGIELDYFAQGRQENSPSFDRVDPSKGYVKDNVVIMSWRANRIKNDGTADEHRQIAAYLDTLAGNVSRASKE